MPQISFALEQRLLADEIHKIEMETSHTNALIRTCLLKAFEICTSQKHSHSTNNSIKSSPKKLSLSPHKDWNGVSQEQTLKKLNEYERRVFVLKLELSTKEQAHEAKVDQLNTLIDKLQARIDDMDKIKPRMASNTFTRPHTTPLDMYTQRHASKSLISTKKLPEITQSPFSGDTTKGSLFGGSDLSKIASKATLKLSKDKDNKPIAGLFSPNNSSAESTPMKQNKKDLNLSSSSILGSELEDTFQTANGTFGDGAERKKKRRIKLLSSQASKVPTSDILHDDADVNSLDYYLDANFHEDSSPSRATKRVLEDSLEPPAKKRHVFKI